MVDACLPFSEIVNYFFDDDDLSFSPDSILTLFPVLLDESIRQPDEVLASFYTRDHPTEARGA